MTKFFNPKGQYKNGLWRKKKIRLPRKMKKWVKQMDEITLKKYRSKYFKLVSSYKILLSYRAHRNYRIGRFYYKQVFKY